MTSAYAAESNRQNCAKRAPVPAVRGQGAGRAVTPSSTARAARLLVLPGEQPEELERQRDAWLASASGRRIRSSRRLSSGPSKPGTSFGAPVRVQQARAEKRMHEAELGRTAAGVRRRARAGQPLAARPPWSLPMLSQQSTQFGAAAHLERRDARRPGSTRAARPPSGDHRCRLPLVACSLERVGRGPEAGNCWPSPDRFRAIRLLGKQPLDATVDREVLRIFLACHVLCPGSKSPFQDLLGKVGERQGDPPPLLRPVLRQLTIEPYTPKDSAAARQVLAGVVDRAASRLRIVLADCEAGNTRRPPASGPAGIRP